MTCGVYKLTSQSGKIYVGSSKNIEVRVADHIKRARGGNHPNPLLNKAWKKYGELTWEVLLVCNEVDLIKNEQRFIDELRPEYNCSKIAGKVDWTPELRASFGAQQRGKKRPPRSEETKRKISISNSGKVRSQSWRENISASKKGKPGHPLSPENRERLRLSRIGTKHNETTRAKMRLAWERRKMQDAQSDTH
jgi:group I intron endonuclease